MNLRAMRGALVLSLLLSPLAALAEEEPSVEERAVRRLAWHLDGGDLEIRKRPDFVYLVGNPDRAAWITGEVDLAAVRSPATLVEVLPAAGWVPTLCRGRALCLPDIPCAEPLKCPPLPLVPILDGPTGNLEDLYWRQKEDGLSLRSVGEGVFLVVEEERVRTLYPGGNLTVRPSVAVYRLEVVGHFDSGFVPFSKLEEGATYFLPCPEGPPQKRFCPVSRVLGEP